MQARNSIDSTMSHDGVPSGTPSRFSDPGVFNEAISFNFLERRMVVRILINTFYDVLHADRLTTRERADLMLWLGSPKFDWWCSILNLNSYAGAMLAYDVLRGQRRPELENYMQKLVAFLKERKPDAV